MPTAASPLDIVTDHIRERVARRREDWLTATYHIVAAMIQEYIREQQRLAKRTTFVPPYA